MDSFTQLLNLYELADEQGGGSRLGAHVQRDWQIFSFDDTQTIEKFLLSSVGSAHEMLAAGATVKLRSVADDDSSNALTSWAQFSEEIRTKNRYFPQAVPDRRVLERVLMEHLCAIHSDVELFRARSAEDGNLPAPEGLGAPPPHKATAGRANPVGIPYLYLAFSIETCIYEARAGNHARLAIGTFRPTRELRVLNLADIDAPDFFSVDDIGATEEQVRRISSHRYLVALGDELRKPVRTTDQPTEYIPTQYLCELAKSLGLDGVLYPSAQHNDGRNVVLFDVHAATTSATDIRLVEIKSMQATWEAL